MIKGIMKQEGNCYHIVWRDDKVNIEYLVSVSLHANLSYGNALIDDDFRQVNFLEKLDCIINSEENTTVRYTIHKELYQTQPEDPFITFGYIKMFDEFGEPVDGSVITARIDKIAVDSRLIDFENFNKPQFESDFFNYI